MKGPLQGEVWDVELDPTVGHEQGGRRPALIVSSDGMNTAPRGLVMILPITSRIRAVPSHYRVEPPEGGLAVPSCILGEQLRSISTQRLRKHRGSVSADTLEQVQRILRVLLDLS